MSFKDWPVVSWEEWTYARQFLQASRGELRLGGSAMGRRVPVRQGFPWPAEYRLRSDWRDEIRKWTPGNIEWAKKYNYPHLATEYAGKLTALNTAEP